MKFTIKSGKLQDLLTLLKSYMSPIDAIPSTFDVLFEVLDGKLALAMFGTTNAAVISCDISNGENGKALITPGRMLPALGRHKNDYIVVESTNRGQVTVSWEGKNDLATFEGGVPETFYPLQPPPKGEYLRMTLDEAVRIHSVFSPLQTAKLNFVQVTKIDETTVDFVATDEWILSRATVDATCDGAENWYLPPNSLDIISSLAHALDIPGDRKNIRVKTTDEFTYILFPGGYFRSLIPQGTTPIQYAPYFDAHRYGKARVHRLRFSRDVAAVLNLVPDPTDTMSIDIGTESITLRGVGRLSGSCSYESKAVVTGTPLPLRVLSQPFNRMIRGASGTEIDIEWGENFLLVTDDAKTTLIGLEATED